MDTHTPSQAPAGSSPAGKRRRWILLSILGAFGLGLALLHPLRLLRVYSDTTGSMAPTVLPGDQVVMEGFTYRLRNPQRGEVVVMRTEGIDRFPPRVRYMRRIAGMPGEHVLISEGKLFINGIPTVLSNGFAEITHHLPSGPWANLVRTNVTVPLGQYFVLGDCSTNSSDSRFWGCVPAGNIEGRIVYCSSPFDRVGFIR